MIAENYDQSAATTVIRFTTKQEFIESVQRSRGLLQMSDVSPPSVTFWTSGVTTPDVDNEHVSDTARPLWMREDDGPPARRVASRATG